MEDNYYINRAIILAEEAEKTHKAVKNCLTESKLFPIYLADLQTQVDNLMYLNVANNAVLNEKLYFSKKKTLRKRK